MWIKGKYIYQLIYVLCQEHLQEHTGKKIGFITIFVKTILKGKFVHFLYWGNWT